MQDKALVEVVEWKRPRNFELGGGSREVICDYVMCDVM